MAAIFPHDISKYIFLNEKLSISIKISLRFVAFVLKGPIINFLALVLIMATARRQAIIWTNDDSFTDANMRNSASMS